jgi:hypothetical protein
MASSDVMLLMLPHDFTPWVGNAPEVPKPILSSIFASLFSSCIFL